MEINGTSNAVGKRCTKCGHWKVCDGGFHHDKSTRDGWSTICAECRNTQRRKPPAPEDPSVPLRAAQHRALLRLVRRHRAEFDTLVGRELKERKAVDAKENS